MVLENTRRNKCSFLGYNVFMSEETFPYEIQDKAGVGRALAAMPDKNVIDILASFYKVMADQTRLSLLTALEAGELCATDLANVAGMSRSAVSHQLKALKDAHLVKSRKEGKTVYYELDDEHIHKVLSVALEHVKEDRT